LCGFGLKVVCLLRLLNGVELDLKTGSSPQLRGWRNIQPLGEKMDFLANRMACLSVHRVGDTIFIPLPVELWRPCGAGGCCCDVCKKDGSNGYWDTMAISVKAPGPGRNDYTFTVHYPALHPAPVREAKARMDAAAAGAGEFCGGGCGRSVESAGSLCAGCRAGVMVRCVASDDEIARDVAALSPTDRAVFDALPKVED
jgi:hypothetical protein